MVLTPEKVIVAYDLASVGPRIVAHLIDLLCYIAISIGLSTFIGFVFAPVPELGQAVATLIFAFAFFLYFIVSEGAFQGYTMGKKLMKMRVLNVDGTPITWRTSILRNLLRVADMLPAIPLVGLIMLFLNPRSQRVGDLVAGTIVIREPERRAGYTPAPHHVGIHPLEQSIGELIGMTVEEYHAIK